MSQNVGEYSASMQSARVDSPEDQQLLRDDENVLLRAFPKEVWEMILAGLTECDDLVAVSNASPFFRNCLYAKRVEFLFPMVFGLVAPKMHEKYDLRKSATINGKASTTRHAYMDSGLLRLRGVCKTWNHGVTTFYQNLESHYDTTGDPECPVSRTTVGTTLYNQKVKLFCFKFDETHNSLGEGTSVNPFPTRSVVMSVNFKTKCCWDRLYLLLQVFGDHIWYLHLILLNQTLSSDRIRSPMRKFLMTLPNLKVLKITDKSILGSVNYNVLQRDEMRAFANLDSLCCLQLENVEHSLAYHLLCSFAEISSLRTSLSFLGHVLHASLPKLTHVTIFVTELEASKCSDLFAHVQQLDRKLCVSSLCLTFDKNGFGVKWSDVFAFLESICADTVTSLRVQLPKMGNAKERNNLLHECMILQLKLPRIKSMRLFLTEFYSIDFLLPMANALEFLEVHMVYTHRNPAARNVVKENERVQFLSHVSNLLESNVWHLFPNLQRIRLFGMQSWREQLCDYSRMDL